MCPEKADIVDALSGYKHDISTIKMHNSLKIRNTSKESPMLESAFNGHKSDISTIKMHGCFQIRDMARES
jgi:hypothetical protein